ncbi:ABC transporter substrate-binding protein [Aquihabitans sp. G128]|uniref:ABC transporter substrate-binding protein n=1 Tax=Aquihabitans sp. G128 TaxID=2849779 RepID=UPI001C23E7B8|nr:ABC transporter substrate-binding protein [Aquihabitans sp. G128]QXC60900.1 ABC transporter substrate-binding protein [Aquihabitans sp. G128]
MAHSLGFTDGSARGRRATGVRRAAVVALVLAASLAACGGEKSGGGATKASGATGLAAQHLTAEDGESGLAKAGKPVRGGTLTYGIEGESNGGFCLPEAQLAISGMLVVRAVYDTLTVPNAEGDYVPYLAKSVTSNDDHTVWTIGLRSGITFHDGSKLDATVVKNNLDAYRGTYPARHSLLFSFLLHDVASVDVVDDLTVKVTTSRPWAAFPAQLYASSRMGILAQAQLDDPDTCHSKLIGTGPFELESWKPGTSLKAKRNPKYWQTAPDGKPYPYADAIEFKPIPDAQILTNAIRSGEVNIMHTSNSQLIGGTLRKERDAGKLNLLVSSEKAEISFIQLNNTKPPFDDVRMRKAVMQAIDRKAANQFQNDGYATVADGPIPPGSLGYVEDPGLPKYDPKAAKELVADYVADGGSSTLSFITGSDAASVRFVEYLRQQLEKVDIKVTIKQLDQTAAINAALGKSYQAGLFRNYPGGDPDELKVWFAGGLPGTQTANPVNLAGFDDPVVNQALEDGRSEGDPKKREAIYQKLVKRMAEQVFDVWLWDVPWGIATAADVHGIMGPPLPGDDPSKPGPATTKDAARQPSPGLATGHSLLGLWVAT